jgi:putative flippase GtrA
MIVLPTMDPGRRRILLFLAAGAVNTLFGYAAFAALILLGIRPAAATIGAAVAGILFNFRTFGMVFADPDPRRFVRFVAAYVLLIALNLLLLRLLTAAGLHVLVAQGVTLPPIAILSFLLMRGFVFAPMSSREARR